MKAVEISRTGLDVEWRRLEVIAENLANASTSRTALGEPYRAMRLVSGPRAGFSQALQGAATAADVNGVAIYGVEPIEAPPRRVYEPSNPQADADGFVSYPGFDHAGEMALMIKTARVYEAGVVAASIAERMYAKALDIGKR